MINKMRSNTRTLSIQFIISNIKKMKNTGILKFGDVTIKILSNSDALTVAELHFAAGTIADVHQHVNEEANYVVRGTFEASSNDTKTILNPGDIIDVSPNAKHNLKCISDEGGLILTAWTPSRKDLISKLS